MNDRHYRERLKLIDDIRLGRVIVLMGKEAEEYKKWLKEKETK